MRQYLDVKIYGTKFDHTAVRRAHVIKKVNEFLFNTLKPTGHPAYSATREAPSSLKTKRTKDRARQAASRIFRG